MLCDWPLVLPRGTRLALFLFYLRFIDVSSLLLNGTESALSIGAASSVITTLPSSQILISPSSSAFVSGNFYSSSLSSSLSATTQSTLRELAVSSSALSSTSTIIDSSHLSLSTELLLPDQSNSSDTTGLLYTFGLTTELTTTSITLTVDSGKTEILGSSPTPFTITAPSTAPTIITWEGTFWTVERLTPAAEASSISAWLSADANGIDLLPSDEASFAKLPACTASWISANPSLFSSIGDAYACCGQCNFFFNNIQVYYWPVPDANTACLTNSSYYPDYGYPMDERALKMSNTGSSRIYHDMIETNEPEPPSITLQARMPLNVVKVRNDNVSLESYTVIDGITIVSPSVYVDFGDVSASNDCGQVGSVYDSVRIVFAPGELSTSGYVSEAPPQSFNFGDLPCVPFSIHGDLPSNADGYGDPQGAFIPKLAVPAKLLAYDPAWSSCVLDVYHGYDPPRAMTPVAVPATSTRSQDSHPIYSSALPGSSVSSTGYPTPNIQPVVSSTASKTLSSSAWSSYSGGKPSGQAAETILADPDPVVQSPPVPTDLGIHTDIAAPHSLFTATEGFPSFLLTATAALASSPWSSSHDPKTSSGEPGIDPGDPARPSDSSSTSISPSDPPPTSDTSPTSIEDSLDPQTQVQTSQLFTIPGTAKPTGFSISGMTLSVDEPGVTISGTVISLATSENLVIGSSTYPLTSAGTGFDTDSGAVLTMGGQTLTAAPWAPTYTSGTHVGSDSSMFIIGGTMVNLLPSTSVIPLTIDGQVVTPENDSINVAGASLHESGPGTIISGTSVSVAPSGLIIGSRTIPLTFPTSIFTIGSDIITANPSGFEFGSGSTIIPGSPAMTINDTTISLAPSGTLIIGTRTVPLMMSKTQGLGAAIMSGFGEIGPSTSISVGTPESFKGGQPKATVPNTVFLIAGFVLMLRFNSI